MTEKTTNMIFDIVKNIVLLCLLVITLYPFLNIIAVSFNDAQDSIRGGIKLWPRIPTLYNYTKLLTQPRMGIAFFNSVLRLVIGVTSAVICNSMVAFVLTRKNYIFRKQLNMMYIFTMYVSGSLIPTYFLFRAIGLINSFNVYWIPWGVVPYYMIVMRTYMQGLPESLIEAAKVEGANDFMIYRKIIMPLSMPVLATIALFTAVDQWNSWFDTFLFATKLNLTTIQFEMQRILGAAQSSGGKKVGGGQTASINPKALKAAMTVIACLPIMCLYPFAQRYFVSGLTIGGVKG